MLSRENTFTLVDKKDYQELIRKIIKTETEQLHSFLINYEMDPN